MRARHSNGACADIKRAVPHNGCWRRDLNQRTLALSVLLASLRIVTTDALSLHGSGLFRRHAASSSRTSTELGRLPHNYHDDQSLFDDYVRSPASVSPLFTSPSYRARGRGGRREFVITQHRRQLFRRQANFQLNYKDHDDELMHIIESQQPLMTLRPRVLRRLSGKKSLTKTLFPPVPEEDYDDEDLVSFEQLSGMPDDFAASSEMEEDALELPGVRLNDIIAKAPGAIGKIRQKKKRSQVVVSNINELHDVVLDRGFELRDVELKYSPPPSLLSSKKHHQQSADAVEATSSKRDQALQVLLTRDSNPDHGKPKLIRSASPQIELEENYEPNAEEWQLIGNVLAEDSPFLTDEETPASQAAEQLFSHDVLNLLHRRYHSQSTPMSRGSDDTAKLALSIEGGGMRGAVSGGMAAAIACLGLSNAFDSVYGSSAGSIIGSYFVSRQLYLDVYTDILSAGKDLFISKSKIFGDIFRNAFHVMKQGGPLGKRLNANLIERWNTSANPMGVNATSSMETLPPTRAGGLNISFVLDSIMCPERGLRPLDLEAFSHNDAIQPLRIVSSSVELETGKLKSICFGSKEGHFRDEFAKSEGSATYSSSSSTGDSLYPKMRSAKADDNGIRHGLWACLGASMLVPGAADSPFRMYLPSSDDANPAPTPHLCFDAFCYEPVPFRSAVAEGATHVLALRSRPAGFEPKTKPTLYERAVAPLYFRSNGAPKTVAEFFERGGQQYLYAEDVLISDQGLNSTEPIPIPPAKVLYAGPELSSETDREKWARAHLLPITVPADVPELSTLASNRDDIIAGMRSGFAAAYNALAPVVGVEMGPDSLDGMQVAELVFPNMDAPHESVLEKQFPLAGEKLGKAVKATTDEENMPVSRHGEETKTNAVLSSVPSRSGRFRRLQSVRGAFGLSKRSNESAEHDASKPEVRTSPPSQDADSILSFLPGVQLDTFPMVVERLQSYIENHSFLESA